jgi:hypothetical protein
MYLGHKRLKTGSGVLRPQEPCNGTKKLVEVSQLKEAGLEFTTSFLYVRGEVVRTWEFLQADGDLKTVYGPPGVGKSTVVWAWACHKAANSDMIRICWIHKLGGDLLHVVLLSATDATWWQVHGKLQRMVIFYWF